MLDCLLSMYLVELIVFPVNELFQYFVDDPLLWSQSFGIDEALLSCSDEGLSTGQQENCPSKSSVTRDDRKRFERLGATFLLLLLFMYCCFILPFYHYTLCQLWITFECVPKYRRAKLRFVFPFYPSCFIFPIIFHFSTLMKVYKQKTAMGWLTFSINPQKSWKLETSKSRLETSDPSSRLSLFTR